MNVIEGNRLSSGIRFGIVASRFNEFITSRLLSGALDAITRHGGSKENVTLLWVPGAFEIPLAAQRLARSADIDAVICLGAVIRGSTPHFDYVAAEVSKGIAQVSLTTEKPVIFGVLTTNTLEEAIERAGSKGGNKGFDAALTAIEMVNLLTAIPLQQPAIQRS